MIFIRNSVPSDVPYLAPRLREEDKAEVLAAGSPSVEASLQHGLNSPDGCFTGTDERGVPMVIFGTLPHPLEEMAGIVWLLATPEILQQRTDFLRKSLVYVAGFQDRYPILMNFTDCRNTVHHRWLRWCGFDFINTVTGLGPGDHPFFEVVRIRKDNV